MSELSKSFIIRKLKSGEMVYLIRDIQTESGDGASLLQTYSQDTNTFNPDWSVSSEQPIIHLEAITSNGLPAIISGCNFTYAGENINFLDTANSDGWYEESGAIPRFSYKLEDGKVLFRVISNLASGDGINKTLSYRVTGMTSGNSEFGVYGAVDFIFPLTSESTYWVQLVTDSTTLGLVDGDTEITSTNLSIMCGRGVNDVTGAVWDLYKNGVIYRSNLESNSSVTITRNDVNGSEVFSAYLKIGGLVVAKDGITIYDVADEYLVAYKTVSGDGTISHTKSSTFSPYILRNLKEMTTPENAIFVNEVFNADGELVRTVKGESITISAADCVFIQSGVTQYGDVEIRCTASW